MNFNVGDLCECVHDISGTNSHLVGMQCVVLGQIQDGRSWNLAAPDRPGYMCRFADGFPRLCYPEELRKLPPPQDPAFVKWRNALVKEFAMGAPTHV